MEKTKPKILIIEDEKPMVRALELKLTHAGFEAKVAHNGEDGVTMVTSEAFDLIVLDIVMPKLDGFKFLEMMNEKKITTPVIVLSNLSQQEDENRARELGAREFLVKSDTPIMKVVEHIEKILHITA